MAQDCWEERRLKSTRRAGEVRDEWERDYARIIHSSAFRRLQSKTQVLGLGESDFYRTRLTHSMEVAQIGTGIVRWIRGNHASSEPFYSWLPTDALMNAICLSHDLGHPPFGHGGEVALNICMRDHGGFEGNGQTLRILSKLDKYTDGFGMNPTRRLLLGVLKYPAPYERCARESVYGPIAAAAWLSQASEQKPPKCYLDCDSEVVDWILYPIANSHQTDFCEVEDFIGDDGNPEKHSKPKFKSFDTSIMEIADDISYGLHDLEDAISLGLITRNDWDSHNEGKKGLFAICEKSYEEISSSLFSEKSHHRKNAIGDLVHCLIKSVHVGKTGISGGSCPLLEWNAFMAEEHAILHKHIFSLVVKKVIKSTGVQQLEFKGQRLVVELFTALNSDPLRFLPESTKVRYRIAQEKGGAERVICDYVSGMTDDYATRLYEKIFHPHKGSIFDRL